MLDEQRKWRKKAQNAVNLQQPECTGLNWTSWTLVLVCDVLPAEQCFVVWAAPFPAGINGGLVTNFVVLQLNSTQKNMFLKLKITVRESWFFLISTAWLVWSVEFPTFSQSDCLWRRADGTICSPNHSLKTNRSLYFWVMEENLNLVHLLLLPTL